MKNQQDVWLENLCLQGVQKEVFPGVAAGFAYRKTNNWQRRISTCGKVCNMREADYVKDGTYFDLASLTKPICTTLGIYHLISAGKITLADSLISNLTQAGGCESITVQDLLSHASGLPAYRAYYRSFIPLTDIRNKKILVSMILQEPLEIAPGEKQIYSDLGFILLGCLIEEVSGLSLDQFFHNVLIKPLGLENELFFLPLKTSGLHHEDNKKFFAATELCPWRKRLICGEVHDEHSWLMGGVAGHAGLFGRVEAVLTICELLVDIWHGRSSHPFIKNDIVKHGLSYRSPGGNWALGFDRPTPGRSSSGHLFSSESIGHLGFTGTSFWVDLQQERIIVLLTNRVNPSRENKKIQEFRPYFHDRVMEKIEEMK